MVSSAALWRRTLLVGSIWVVLVLGTAACFERSRASTPPALDTCSVCGLSGEVSSHEEAFHHYGIHGHPEAYLVRVDQVELREKTDDVSDILDLTTTIVQPIKGERDTGSNLSFSRCFDYRLGDLDELPYLAGNLYYVFLDHDDAGDLGVSCQSPQSMVEQTNDTRTTAERHMTVCQ